MESPEAIETEAYPLDLHYVKALFLEKDYRRCVQACREILRSGEGEPDAHPVRDTFVRFYLALAHDELARAMHNFSQAKIPAFTQAEQLYDDAITALPTAAECLAFVTKDSNDAEPDHVSSRPETPSPSRHDSLQSHVAKDPSRDLHSEASATPTPTHVRHGSLLAATASTAEGLSDFDDLESHDSFRDIMTPTRIPKLERDYSSMSLLQPAQRHMSHGLLRPVRLGSPAKPYQLPSLPPGSQSAQHRSRLPRLDTSPQRTQLRTQSEQASPVESPVSPVGSDGDLVFSDDSTISPVSPDSPFSSWRYTSDPGTYEAELRHYKLLEMHIQAMRTQLHSHLRLLKLAKLKTSDAQAERSLAHATNDRRAKEIARASSSSGRLSSGPSYWSFTPEDVRVVEKQNRIQAARAREWKRDRFDPTRYQELADAAVSEL